MVCVYYEVVGSVCESRAINIVPTTTFLSWYVASHSLIVARAEVI